ncbi:hypothetical protein Rhe02_28170 [Rhizocola hellebori]|uniref:F5/8 type C domain-containing protein n=1 Tax=Rhizocola hellebori TaxID=1392758 RepID=A0A8J3VFR1_9ACTN|nr:discoidin domain-containing protein [Rhizocola hellebori]GIH04750.1 hypothetical protein Rhe02_28170 [Rhizocola hellebori]
MNVLRRAALLLAGLIVSVPGVMAVSTPARADPIRTGMTWSVVEQGNGYVHLGSDGVTNPYNGDTAIDQYHSVLCLRSDGQAPPPGIAFDFYNGWSGGSVRATAPVRGDVLATPEDADGLCANTFGPGYRLAEFHDGRYGADFSQAGGWSFWAAGGGLLPGTRYWVAISDQPANPWNSLGAWPEPLPVSDQNDMILRAKLSELVSPLLLSTDNAALQNLVRTIAGRLFDGDSNALMSTVIAEAEAGGIVNPWAPDWVAFKNGVAGFANVNGHAYLPQIFIPNYEDGLLLNNPIRMAIAGDQGQSALPAYTLSGGQVVATTPVTESYAETREVWVLTINDELGGGGASMLAAKPAVAGPLGLSQSYSTRGGMGTMAVCNPTGLRNDRGQEYLSWFRVPNPAAVEAWWQGKLEIRMITVARSGMEIKNAYFGKIKRADARNGINWEMFMTTWDRAALGDYWAYKWVEEDNGPKIEISLGLSAWIKQLLNIPLTVDIKATFEAKHDDMGAGVVGFIDSTYMTYSTAAIEWRVCSIGGDGGTGNDNFARQAIAAASSTYSGYSPARVNDGDRNTSVGGGFSWANNSGGVNYPPQWVQLDFGTVKTFRRIVVFTSQGLPIRDFDIQVWNGTTWRAPIGGAVRGNTALQVTVNFTFGSETSRLVRVYGLSGPTVQPGYVRVNEFEVYAS